MSVVDKVVLIPRFTAFAGPQTFRSAPIDVRDYATADLTGWRSGAVGSFSLLAMKLEESADLLTWREVGSSLVAPSERTESTTSCELEFPWARVSVTLSGAGAAVTAWLVGNFTRRDR